MKHGIIFWGTSCKGKKSIYITKEKLVRIIAGVIFRGLFNRLEIFHLPFEYIFSLINFTVNNREHVQANSATHSANTRNKHRLHRPTANLSAFQIYAYYAIFNNLLSSLNGVMNEKAQRKVA
jgi:hypothetical protein